MFPSRIGADLLEDHLSVFERIDHGAQNVPLGRIESLVCERLLDMSEEVDHARAAADGFGRMGPDEAVRRCHRAR